MKPLSFKLDSTTYTVPPEGYTVSNSETTGYKCMIFVSSKFDTQSVDLGTLFLTNFVMSYDYSSTAVRLGVNTNAPEGTTMVTDSPTPDPEDGKKQRTGLWIAIIILILAAIIVGAWYLYDRRRSNNQAMKAVAYEQIER